jgi:hypothetical protein
MTYTITTEGNISDIHMSFVDEGVALVASRKVAGDRFQAEVYVKVLEHDVRNDNMELFPLPEVEVTDMMEGM